MNQADTGRFIADCRKGKEIALEIISDYDKKSVIE